jgi:hypothetical protein
VTNKPSDGHHRRVDLPNINSPDSQPSISNFKAPHRPRKASEGTTTTIAALTKMHRQQSQDIHQPQTIHKPLQPAVRKPKPLPSTLPSMDHGSKTNLAQAPDDPIFQKPNKNGPSPLPSVKSSEPHPTVDGKLPSLTSVTTWKDEQVADSRLGHRVDDSESIKEN